MLHILSQAAAVAGLEALQLESLRGQPTEVQAAWPQLDLRLSALLTQELPLPPLLSPRH